MEVPGQNERECFLEQSKEDAFLAALGRWLADVLEMAERAVQRTMQEPPAVQRFGYLNPKMFSSAELMRLSNEAAKAKDLLAVLSDELLNLVIEEPQEEASVGA